MTKQRPDPDKLANELSGASAFFRKPTPAPAEPASAPEGMAPPMDSMTPAPLSTRPPVSVPATAPARLGRRQIVRHSFELYADQIDQLRDHSIQQRLRGEPGSMSQMVRDALDRYLTDRRSS